MSRVLVVDDDDAVRLSCCRALEDAGYQVESAVDGNKAIEVLRETPVDVMITDIIMPDKEGMELIMEVSRDFPDVKIIAISGGGRIDPADYIMAARGLGAARTFRKPFDLHELSAAVKDLIEEGERPELAR